MATESEKSLMSDAKNFCDSLGNVFMMKKRDPQTRHLLEQAKYLIEGKRPQEAHDVVITSHRHNQVALKLVRRHF